MASGLGLAVGKDLRGGHDGCRHGVRGAQTPREPPHVGILGSLARGSPDISVLVKIINNPGPCHPGKAYCMTKASYIFLSSGVKYYYLMLLR